MTQTMAATPTASPRGRQRRVKCSRTSRLFLCYCAIIGFVLFMGNGIMLPGCQASTSYRHGHTPSPEASSISPLRAFKQLGFDDVMGAVHRGGNTYGSSHTYSSSGRFGSYLGSASGTSSQQVVGGGVHRVDPAPNGPNHRTTAHPNDILANMGVELPAQQILD